MSRPPTGLQKVNNSQTFLLEETFFSEQAGSRYSKECSFLRATFEELTTWGQDHTILRPEVDIILKISNYEAAL